jgi:hypothetical protein
MNQFSFYKLKFLAIAFAACALLFAVSVESFGQKVRLRGRITPECGNNSNSKFADIYADGNIAVQGSYGCRGAFIYDISNPEAPALAAWYNPDGAQQFLEAVVIGNRGYFGSGNGGGVHIVDLTVPSQPKLLGIVNSAKGNGFNSIHEMVVHGNFLIENYNGFSNKIIKVINISDPANPVFVRDINPTESAWVHAMHIRGNRMFTSGWGSSVERGRTEIYDITNLGTQAPTLLGYIEDATSVTAGNSMHSSWSSEDGNYLYSARETTNGSGDIRVYNIQNPAQPLLVNRVTMDDLNLNAVTPHNPVVMGNHLYVSWYQAGVQVFDISNPAKPVRVGQYDTYQAQFAPSEAEKQTLAESEPWDLVCGTANRQNILPQTFDGNWAVFPFLGQKRILAGDLKEGLFILDATGVGLPSKNQVSDFDGDGKTDLSVFTPNSGDWQFESSSNNSVRTINYGLSEDKIVTGDYDGDAKADLAIYRPSTGYWWILGSTSGSRAVQFGLGTDIPVPADYDADGKTDIAVWRPSTGVWYIMQSTLGFKAYTFGLSGDKPVVGDYEADGKADIAVYRPSTGVWYILQSSSSQLKTATFGLATDKPLSADFDGDGKTDFAVYRPTEGNWYVLTSANNQVLINKFGVEEDLPIPADYDGDGKADISVFRPSQNVWYRLNSSDGAFNARVFGQNGDKPSPQSVQPQ